VSAARDALRAALDEVGTDHIVTKQAADSFADEAAAALFSPLPRPVLAVGWEEIAGTGEPFPDTDGNLWRELIFGEDGIVSARADDGSFHQWGTGEQVHDAALRAMRGRA
jgi:hypothetical protein